MNKSTLLLVSFAFGASFAAPAGHAATLFSDDFEDGTYDDWTMSGDQGTDAISEFEGNKTLRLDVLRQATRAISTAGQKEVALSMDIAGLNLVPGDTCPARPASGQPGQ